AFLNFVRRAPADRDAAEIARSTAAAAEMMAILDTELQRQPWLTGDAFGIADIPMGVYAHTFFALPLERPPLPALEDWYARLRTRPGYANLVMIPLT
ncbi:MAG: glutathione S-transferase, partial [Sphingomonadales bacterium]|nr:glutathione S-transferase [Sphingomonadales bacterium]